VSPYLGAGVNYTRISDVNLLGGKADLDNNSFGFALQAGVDFKLDKNWSLNLDVKKVQIRSDVTLGGAKISNVKVDPWLVGVGVGYRF
jgi:outer membrane protein